MSVEQRTKTVSKAKKISSVIHKPSVRKSASTSKKKSQHSSVSSVFDDPKLTKLHDMMWNKFSSWWTVLSRGYPLVVYHKASYNFQPWTRTPELEKQKDIVAFVYGTNNSEGMNHFINFLLLKKTKAVVKTILDSEDDLQYMIDHFADYFEAMPIDTKKDFGLRGVDLTDEQVPIIISKWYKDGKLNWE